MRTDSLQPLRLRDRDAIITEEGIIFRVYGYFHPPNAYVCDPEYAPAEIFKSKNPKALRARGKHVYYKFYFDQGLRFVYTKYPKYRIFYQPLQEKLVGVNQKQIQKTRKPDEAFQQLTEKVPKDSLHKALLTLSNLIKSRSGLPMRYFGVFGSLLHDFYHPELSDLDLIVYGRKNLEELRETLEDIYKEKDSSLKNEFEDTEAIKNKTWNFVNYSPKEYLWHQRRKLIYALFKDNRSGRTIKTEYEPVKDWSEIRNEYSSETRILKKGWIKAVVRVIGDREAAFMPSIYQIEPVKIIGGEKVDDIRRIVSYMEEFRMQVQRDEEAYVEGILEQVMTMSTTFHQITLTYASQYYRQVLKATKFHSRIVLS
jgi:predicted nucleotidyltransferase